jgi:hypothetical protein
LEGVTKARSSTSEEEESEFSGEDPDDVDDDVDGSSVNSGKVALLPVEQVERVIWCSGKDEEDLSPPPRLGGSGSGTGRGRKRWDPVFERLGDCARGGERAGDIGSRTPPGNGELDRAEMLPDTEIERGVCRQDSRLRPMDWSSSSTARRELSASSSGWLVIKSPREVQVD